jgi:predicted dehydrogenase
VTERAPFGAAAARRRPRSAAGRPPRLGFVGLGWIGRLRLAALARSAGAEIVALADPDPRALEAAGELLAGVRSAAGTGADAGGPERCRTLEELLERALDGVVIATPTALHARQAIAALQAGLPVFCQKPLGRDAGECRAVIEAACARGLRLGVDMPYRHTAAVRAALARLRAGAIGRPRACELIFHNAFEPGSGWARDRERAGGGALVDLGWHLLDLAALFFGALEPVAVHADLFAGGERLERRPEAVEDLALAQLTLAGGQAVRLACSWRASTGREAVIEASFQGPHGALCVRNVDGSFYDFEALLVEGRRTERLCGPPDDWGGRALIAWARALEDGYDPAVAELLPVADAIDAIYCTALEGALR